MDLTHSRPGRAVLLYSLFGFLSFRTFLSVDVAVAAAGAAAAFFFDAAASFFGSVIFTCFGAFVELVFTLVAGLADILSTGKQEVDKNGCGKRLTSGSRHEDPEREGADVRMLRQMALLTAVSSSVAFSRASCL